MNASEFKENKKKLEGLVEDFLADLREPKLNCSKTKDEMFRTLEIAFDLGYNQGEKDADNRYE